MRTGDPHVPEISLTAAGEYVLVDGSASLPTAVQFPALTQLTATSDSAPEADGSTVTGALINGTTGVASAFAQPMLAAANTETAVSTCRTATPRDRVKLTK
jgi:hypothetical protein